MAKCKKKSNSNCIKSNDGCKVIGNFLLLTTIFFGLSFLLPYDTFANNSSYSTMSYIADESIWGMFYIIAGIILFIAMRTNNSKLKICGFTIQTFIWSFTGTMFLISNLNCGYIGTGCFTYLNMAGLSYYMTYMIGCE